MVLMVLLLGQCCAVKDMLKALGTCCNWPACTQHAANLLCQPHYQAERRCLSTLSNLHRRWPAPAPLLPLRSLIDWRHSI
jgi:hypothetical protein